MNDSPLRPTVARIDLDALGFNFRSIQNFLGEGVKLMAVVKADAYGHGAVQCSKRLEAEGVHWLGVSSIDEGIELRNAGLRAPLLCFGGFAPGQAAEIVRHDITPVVFDLARVEELNTLALEFGRTVKVHVKIDTGMGRVGVPFRDTVVWADQLQGLKGLNVEGLMTHFAAADDPTDDLTNAQMRRFAEAVSIFHEKGFRPSIIHMANSPGTIAFKDSRSSLVRIGGLLYGLGDDVIPKGSACPKLKPVMTVLTRIAFIKRVTEGDSIGYGRTFMARRDSLIATLPIGYHDGLRRALSNKADVIVKGRLAPIVGRISMDWTTIDITDIAGVKCDDEVTIIGKAGQAKVTAETLARACDTISYEITCGIGTRVPRVFV